MKIALSILKYYISVPSNPEEVAAAFIHLGFEIEGTEKLGYCGEGPLVVGQVIEKVKHPDSDHLSVCKVNVGQQDPLQIVCGASNFTVGDIVPVALEGAKLGDIILKKTRMRGVESCGMMCSASELGLTSGESSGLYILNDLKPTIGTPLEQLFSEKRDVVWDISVTSTRGDCLCYWGLARELSAFFNLPLNTVEINENFDVSNDFATVTSADCDYFSGCLIEGVEVMPSTEAIQSFLQKSGLRAINNVVDVTNCVLLEQGQPLHAFDADQIHGSLKIRKAYQGEELVTLDGQKRVLDEDMLVVADEAHALSIAGVMGGASSEIKSTTRRIFIECAHFSANSIRKTSQKLNLSSDSSYRFERFVDKTNASKALAQALQLLRKTNSGLKVVKYVCLGKDEIVPRVLDVDFNKVKKILGFEISGDIFKQTLEKLNFLFVVYKPDFFKVTVPVYRDDVTQVADLVEEFIRLWGTDKIPTKQPDGVACEVEDAVENKLRDSHAAILSNAGFYECYTDTLQPRTWYEGFLPDEQLRVLTLTKPLSAEHACLRFSLVPGLINCLCENWHHGNAVERLFETGRIFKVNRNGQLCEMLATAFVFCPSTERQWMKTTNFNFYEAQNYVRSLIVASGMQGSVVQTATMTPIPLWQDNYSGKIGLWEQRGFEADLGYLNLNFTQQWFKNEIVFAAECMWLPERIRLKSDKTFSAYSECPSVMKDIALWVPKTVLGEEVRQVIIKSLKKLVKNPVQVQEVRLFDVFYDEQNLLKKSLAFTIVFGSNSGTLTEETVSPIFEALQEMLEKNYDYQVRKQNL